MVTKLNRNSNGQKTLLVKFKGARGFSIPTCGSLFLTHRMSSNDFDGEVAKSEACAYIKQYGNQRQKTLLGKYLK